MDSRVEEELEARLDGIQTRPASPTDRVSHMAASIVPSSSPVTSRDANAGPPTTSSRQNLGGRSRQSQSGASKPPHPPAIVHLAQRLPVGRSESTRFPNEANPFPLPLVAVRQGLSGRRLQPKQGQADKTMPPRSIASNKAENFADDVLAAPERTSVEVAVQEDSEWVSETQEAVKGTSRVRSAGRKKLNRVRALARAARNIDAMIRKARQENSRRRVISTLVVARRAIQEKMDRM